jgi:hypothetical protein
VNATLIESLGGGSLSFIIGVALLAGLLAWLAAEIFRALLRLNAERVQQRVGLEKLQLQLQTMKLRCREAEQAQLGWNGLRKFTVAKKITECEDICAFYLKPHDGRPLSAFKPGQYLTF